MGEYNFDAAKLIAKLWVTLATLFLFAVVMFGVRDPVLTGILPTMNASKSRSLSP